MNSLPIRRYSFFQFAVITLGIHLIMLVGCTSAKKDVYFRSRLPTIESPVLNEHHQIGVSLQSESQRFNVKLTQNLVNDFSFYKNQDFWSDGAPRIPGNDISLSFTNDFKFSQTAESNFPIIPVQVEAIFDLVELKVGVWGHRQPDVTKNIVTINFGYYQSATFEKSGDCEILCFSRLKDQKSVEEKENEIILQHDGQEIKMGLSWGYRITEHGVIFVGYDHMSYHYFSKAFRTTDSKTISFDENFYGYGYGMGYDHRFNENLWTSIAIHQIILGWNAQVQQRGVVSLALGAAF